MSRIRQHHETAAWQRERRKAHLYRTMSDAESGTVRQVLYLELAAHGDNQAQLWHQEARKAGVALPRTWTPGPVDIAAYALVQILGPRWTGWLLWRLGLPGFALYGRFHARGLGRLLSGAVDGLVSNACLVLGVAGLTGDRAVLAMTGLLGLLFGAGLAGLGDWLTMERRLARLGQTGAPPDHLREGEEAGLVALLVSRGMEENHAIRGVQALLDNPDQALRHLPLIIGVLAPGDHDPPQGAALVGLLSFSAGALVPLLGLYLVAAEWAVPFAAGVSALVLWGLGAKRATQDGKPAGRGGTAALLLGSAAALAAWGLGKVLANLF